MADDTPKRTASDRLGRAVYALSSLAVGAAYVIVWVCAARAGDLFAAADSVLVLLAVGLCGGFAAWGHSRPVMPLQGAMHIVLLAMTFAPFYALRAVYGADWGGNGVSSLIFAHIVFATGVLALRALPAASTYGAVVAVPRVRRANSNAAGSTPSAVASPQAVEKAPRQS